jgi:hypothetical protein
VASSKAALISALAVARAIIPEKRRRVKERQESYVMTAPGGDDKHRHCTTVDSEGNGTTAGAADGHVHKVAGLVVLAAGDGHTHEMSAQRCSAPHDRGRCQR